jgi:hypothetical protein
MYIYVYTYIYIYIHLDVKSIEGLITSLEDILSKISKVAVIGSGLEGDVSFECRYEYICIYVYDICSYEHACIHRYTCKYM